MSKNNNYPMLLEPIFKNHLWGGEWSNAWVDNATNKEIFKRAVGESWLMVDLPSDSSQILNGDFAGHSLSQILLKDSNAVLGKNKSSLDLLLKVINPKLPLSVQVHPSNDDFVNGHQCQGKEEAWYVLDIDETTPNGPLIYLGFEDGVTLNDISHAIEKDSLPQILKKFVPKKGDLFHIPPGMVHALGGGVQVLEIQQSSNTTYRLFDYNRVDANGNKRDLHLQEALQVLKLKNDRGGKISLTKNVINDGAKLLIDSDYFKFEMIESSLHPNQIFDTRKNGYHLLHFNEFTTRKIVHEKGEMVLNGIQTLLIPSALGKYQIVNTNENFFRFRN